MNIQKAYALFNRLFRPRRIKSFAQLFWLNTETNIVDIGGSSTFWDLYPISTNITIVNLSLQRSRNKKYKYIIADARKLPFKNKSFEIAFSNSVIEHLYTYENQKLFASECARVSDRYFIQTPNKYFIVEPHFLTPFIHFFPKSIQVKIVRNFTIWGLIARPDQQQCEKIIKEIRLLTKGELKSLFKDGQIEPEKFMGFSKSWLVFKR